MPRRPVASPSLVQRLAIASVVANVLIVVTGGAVRLTASGLGCPTWPRCTDESFVATPEHGIHGIIEFSNRLLTFGVGAVALATLAAALLSVPRRGDVVRLAVALFLGIPLQAVVGGITVLTELNPWVVMLHFLLSMGLVALATVLVQRAGESDGPPRTLVPTAVRRLVLLVLANLAAVLYAGAVVTGSGPHAGDGGASRTGLDPATVSQVHADLVFLLVDLTIGVIAALRAAHAPRRTERAAWVLLAAELAQGLVGFVQYALALPALLVGLHMLGAGVLVAAAVHLLMTTRERVAVPTPRPAESRTGYVTA